jgi:hypothetical protein
MRFIESKAKNNFGENRIKSKKFVDPNPTQPHGTPMTPMNTLNDNASHPRVSPTCPCPKHVHHPSLSTPTVILCLSLSLSLSLRHFLLSFVFTLKSSSNIPNNLYSFHDHLVPPSLSLSLSLSLSVCVCVCVCHSKAYPFVALCSLQCHAC